jgi:hypothetical protein
VGAQAIDWQSAEIGGSLLFSPNYCIINQVGLSLSVPTDLLLRRLYVYLFVSADSTKQVSMTPFINFLQQGQVIGKLPVGFTNRSVLDRTHSSVSFGLQPTPDTSTGFTFYDAHPNSITLDFLGQIPAASSPNYTPAENNTAVIAPYEINLRCDTISIPPWPVSDASYIGRLFLGVLSLKP